MTDPQPVDCRDVEAAAIAHDLQSSTMEAVGVWPADAHHPAIEHLFRLIYRHGPYAPLAIGLGWAAHEIRHTLAMPCAAPVRGELRLNYAVHDPQVVDVVHRLLGYVLRGDVDGEGDLHAAATLLAHSGRETIRVLVGLLDLCAGLRAGTCDVWHAS